MKDNINKQILLPYSIGDKVYVVHDYHKFEDRDWQPHKTRYKEVVIRDYLVETILIEKDGIFLGYETWDGMVKYEDYKHITLGKDDIDLDVSISAKVFTKYSNALDYVSSLQNEKQSIWVK